MRAVPSDGVDDEWCALTAAGDFDGHGATVRPDRQAGYFLFDALTVDVDIGFKERYSRHDL